MGYRKGKDMKAKVSYKPNFHWFANKKRQEVIDLAKTLKESQSEEIKIIDFSVRCKNKVA